MTVVGRREDCDLRIPLSDVSRKHCRLILEGETIKIEDLGSSNGTYRNGERVQQTELVAGDTLQIGPVIFCLQVDGYPADEDLQPITAAATAADTAASGAPGKSGDDAEAEVLELEEGNSGNSGGPGASRGSGGSKTDGEFDPMEALESAEGSAFDFQIDESQAGAKSPVDLEESGH